MLQYWVCWLILFLSHPHHTWHRYIFVASCIHVFLFWSYLSSVFSALTSWDRWKTFLEYWLIDYFVTLSINPCDSNNFNLFDGLRRRWWHFSTSSLHWQQYQNVYFLMRNVFFQEQCYFHMVYQSISSSKHLFYSFFSDCFTYQLHFFLFWQFEH